MNYILYCYDVLAFIAPIALAPFLIVHCRQVTIAPFLAIELLPRRLSP